MYRISASGGRRKLGVEQEFAVAFAAENRRFDPFECAAAEVPERGFHLWHGGLLRRLVAHDSALADQFPAHFELRFHQDHDLARLAGAAPSPEDTARITAGSTSVAEMKETSMAMKSIRLADMSRVR